MTAEDNKQLVRRGMDELFNKGNLGAAEELVHPEATAGRPPGPEGMRQTVSWLRDAFADLRMEIEDMVAEDDRWSLV